MNLNISKIEIIKFFMRGVLLPGAPKPRNLIKKLIKLQVQIYYLHL